MATIQIAIEGPGAKAAAAEIFSIDGIDGSYKTVEEKKKDGSLAVIGTIVGIAVGGMTIGEKLHKVYQSHRTKDQQQRIEKMLIVTPNARLLMEDVTPEEITNALKILAK